MCEHKVCGTWHVALACACACWHVHIATVGRAHARGGRAAWKDGRSGSHVLTPILRGQKACSASTSGVQMSVPESVAESDGIMIMPMTAARWARDGVRIG